MKSLWIKLNGKWEEIKPLVTSSIEAAVDVLVVEEVNVKKVKELAREVKVATKGKEGDIKIVEVDKRESLKDLKEEDCALIEVNSKEKEELAVLAGERAGWLLIDA